MMRREVKHKGEALASGIGGAPSIGAGVTAGFNVIQVPQISDRWKTVILCCEASKHGNGSS